MTQFIYNKNGFRSSLFVIILIGGRLIMWSAQKETKLTVELEKTPLLLRHPPSPEKSFSLTSLANTGATQSIQTTRRSLLKQQQQQQVSQRCSKHKEFTFS